MREMAAIDPGEVSYSAPADVRGDRTLEPRIEDGVKVFDLDVSVIEWNILPDQSVEAYAFNRQVPGPRLRVTDGDRVRINVTNNLPEPTSVHWHGMILPNRMDGAADVTQKPIEPGESFAYEFTSGQPGTYFYHSHKEPDRQQGLGMYGALIVDPKDPSRDAADDYDQEVVIQLQEWLERDGYTYPAMIMEGALPNYFTINGKSYPETETINMQVGERLRIRFIGSNNNFVHPMHVHGGPFEIVETDGNVVPEEARLLKDTVNVDPGERYDVIWEAREPGKWLLHCHIPHHTSPESCWRPKLTLRGRTQRYFSVSTTTPALVYSGCAPASMLVGCGSRDAGGRGERTLGWRFWYGGTWEATRLVSATKPTSGRCRIDRASMV